MSRKLMVTLALALVMVLSVSAAVFAQGPGPANTQGGQQMWQQQDGTGLGTCTDFVDEDGDGVCDNALMDGTHAQAGMMARRGGQSQMQGQMLRGQGLGEDFVDANGDGVCDLFVDADGDGINDAAPQDGTGKQLGRSQGMRGMQGQGRNR